ncbi:MAG: hypothetical protein QOH04_2753 [Sphingomonadales bacterium]|jgi:hypothetical protein|nr:hypothetical protein [Sphingomonadales bacterium]
MPESIPVVCDRCRAEGLAGAEGFEDLGGLLDFEPVPLRYRVDGFSPDVQRAFIAALAVTGSDRQAAIAVGKSPFAVDQLKKHEGNEGFMAAREKALAMAKADKDRRLAAGVHAITRPAAHWRPPEPAWGKAATRRRAEEAAALALPPPAANDGAPGGLTPDAERVQIELLHLLVDKYLLKLREERRARLEGCIAAADFYLRQITCVEVALDVMSGDAMALLKDARLGRHDLLTIAETPASKLLDEARRLHWEECGDPPRPAPQCHLLEDQGGYATEPLEHYGGSEDHAAKGRRYQELYARDAEAQVAWEAEARADWAARRADGRITDADIEAARGDEEHWLDAAVRVGRAMGPGEAEG